MSEIKASDLGPMSSWHSKEFILNPLLGSASLLAFTRERKSCASCLHARMNDSANDFCVDLTRQFGEGALRARLTKDSASNANPCIYCSIRQTSFDNWDPCRLYVSSVMRYSGD